MFTAAQRLETIVVLSEFFAEVGDLFLKKGVLVSLLIKLNLGLLKEVCQLIKVDRRGFVVPF